MSGVCRKRGGRDTAAVDRCGAPEGGVGRAATPHASFVVTAREHVQRGFAVA